LLKLKGIYIGKNTLKTNFSINFGRPHPESLSLFQCGLEDMMMVINDNDVFLLKGVTLENNCTSSVFFTIFRYINEDSQT